MAKNKIKGITIEFGGDTTKLNAALDSVDSNLRTTENELKKVDRALKIDPQNVILLEQKQRLLSEAASEAAQKEDVLRQAVEKADQALESGKAYAESYKPLQEALEKANEQLELLKKRQLEIADYTVAGAENEAALKKYYEQTSKGFREITKAIEEQEQQANKTKKQIADLQKQYSERIDQKQYDELQRQFAVVAAKAKDADDALSDFNEELEHGQDVARDTSDDYGSISDAFGSISDASGNLLSKMLGTVSSTEEFRSDLSKLNTNAQMAGVGLDSMRSALTVLNTVSDETDSSVEALSNLLQSGVTETHLQKAVENLAGAAIAFPDTIKIESLADSLQETLATREATGQFAELLDRLGVGAKNFDNQLDAIPSSVDRLKFALDTLNHEGMADFYTTWVEGNKALVEGKDANLEMVYALSKLAEALQPIVTAVTEFATTLLGWFNDLDDGSKALLVTVLGAFAAINPVAGTLSKISGAMDLFTKVSNIFSSTAGDQVYLTFLKWAGIITAVVLAVAALIALIGVLTGKGDEINKTLGNLGNASQSSFGGSSGGGFTGSSRLNLDSLPAFANGGVFMPNNPVLGVLGDNPRETEIAAPESALRDTFRDVLDEAGYGAGQNVNVTVHFTGTLAPVVRELQPLITVETARQGHIIGGRS